MTDLESKCFQIISSVGSARSFYIQALRLAKAGDFIKMKEMMDQGDEAYLKGHREHAKIIEMEANGNLEALNILVMHAEDLMMSAEVFKLLAEEFSDTFKEINELKKKIEK